MKTKHLPKITLRPAKVALSASLVFFTICLSNYASANNIDDYLCEQWRDAPITSACAGEGGYLEPGAYVKNNNGLWQCRAGDRDQWGHTVDWVADTNELVEYCGDNTQHLCQKWKQAPGTRACAGEGGYLEPGAYVKNNNALWQCRAGARDRWGHTVNWVKDTAFLIENCVNNVESLCGTGTQLSADGSYCEVSEERRLDESELCEKEVKVEYCDVYSGAIYTISSWNRNSVTKSPKNNDPVIHKACMTLKNYWSVQSSCIAKGLNSDAARFDGMLRAASPNHAKDIITREGTSRQMADTSRDAFISYLGKNGMATEAMEVAAGEPAAVALGTAWVFSWVVTTIQHTLRPEIDKCEIFEDKAAFLGNHDIDVYYGNSELKWADNSDDWLNIKVWNSNAKDIKGKVAHYNPFDTKKFNLRCDIKTGKMGIYDTHNTILNILTSEQRDLVSALNEDGQGTTSTGEQKPASVFGKLCSTLQKTHWSYQKATLNGISDCSSNFNGLGTKEELAGGLNWNAWNKDVKVKDRLNRFTSNSTEQLSHAISEIPAGKLGVTPALKGKMFGLSMAAYIHNQMYTEQDACALYSTTEGLLKGAGINLQLPASPPHVTGGIVTIGPTP